MSEANLPLTCDIRIRCGDLRRALTFTLALVLTLLSSSCASSARLGRLSPLVNDASRDRVSLWPLVYHSGGGTAVLWPIFDVDEKGFAVRPLVAKDGPEWDVLYPWAHSDTSTGNGWAVPFYWTRSNSGVFPIANFGEFSYVGPIWWKRNGAGEVTSGGLFPLIYFGETKYIGLIWWCKSSGGLFPLIHFGNFNYVGPAWWNRESGAFGLFPLFGTGEIRHVGPVWWEPKSDGGPWAGLFPLVWFDNGMKHFGFFPFYAHDLGEKSRTRNYLLGLIHTGEKQDSHENWALPFYYDHKSPSSADTLVFPFYWKRTRGEKAQVFTLLGNRSVDPSNESFNLYPFWWSNESQGSSWNMLLPFFYYGKNGDERTLLTPLGGRAWSNLGVTRYLNVLGPIYHHSLSADGTEERTAFLWPLFERHRKAEETTTRAAPFFSSSSSPERREGWYGLGLGHFQSTPDGSSHRFWPLYSVSDEEHSPGYFYDLTLYGSRTHAGRTERHLFPMYSGESSATESQASFLLGLGGYSRTQGNTSWRLWPLAAHSENEDDSPIVHWTTLFGTARWPSHESWHLGGPLIYSSRVDEEGGIRARKRRLLTFFTDERLDALGHWIPQGTRPTRENLVHQSEQAFLFGAFMKDHREYRVWRAGVVSDADQRTLSAFSSRYDDLAQSPRDESRARQILSDHAVSPAQDTAAALQKAVAAFVDSQTEVLERDKFRLPLLYNYENDGKSVEWSGPLWLISSKTEPAHSTFSVFYYGYRSETKGDETRRDIFPFITYDTSPKGVNTSFLWRLFHYQRVGARSGGHVLFIPWGDV